MAKLITSFGFTVNYAVVGLRYSFPPSASSNMATALLSQSYKVDIIRVSMSTYFGNPDPNSYATTANSCFSLLDASGNDINLNKGLSTTVTEFDSIENTDLFSVADDCLNEFHVDGLTIKGVKIKGVNLGGTGANSQILTAFRFELLEY